MPKVPLLAVGKMPDDVVEELLLSFGNSEGDGNPNGEVDYRKVNAHTIKRETSPYVFIYDMAVLYRKRTGVRWDFVDVVQVMEYGVGGFYGSHTDWTLTHDGVSGDHGIDGFRKVSFIAQLSEPDDYEGGLVNIWLDGDAFVVPKEKGTVVAFPSFNMHAVEPITAGTRLSMVSWVLGKENWV
jgi:hypothetical protein